PSRTRRRKARGRRGRWRPRGRRAWQGTWTCGRSSWAARRPRWPKYAAGTFTRRRRPPPAWRGSAGLAGAVGLLPRRQGIVAADHEPHVLGDVGGVVADALQVLGH